MVIDSSANYAKEITKEKGPLGPYAINTCFNQVPKQTESLHVLKIALALNLQRFNKLYTLLNYLSNTQDIY